MATRDGQVSMLSVGYANTKNECSPSLELDLCEQCVVEQYLSRVVTASPQVTRAGAAVGARYRNK